MLIQYSYFNIRYSNINRMKLSSFPIKERGTKCPFVRLLDMKKKERMRIYTLLLGALIACPMQAQTTHDWEIIMFSRSIVNRHELLLFLFPRRKEIVLCLWMESGSSVGLLCLMKES